MKSFSWLENYDKTPMDFGLPRDELDPAWEEAMLILKNALEAERRINLPTR